MPPHQCYWWGGMLPSRRRGRMLLMGRRAWIKLGVLVTCLASLFWGLRALGIRPDDVTPDKIRTFVLSFGAWAPAIYLAVYGQPIVPLPAR